MKILFMCVANSARSQLAEAIAKKVFKSSVKIESAGSEPKKVNPYAIRVLQEIGIDISKSLSKSTNELYPRFLVDVDYVITLCAEEVCPVLPSLSSRKLHWPFPDPAGHSDSDEEQIIRFRIARDNILAQIEKFALELNLK
jgi:arsenate reductase